MTKRNHNLATVLGPYQDLWHLYWYSDTQEIRIDVMDSKPLYSSFDLAAYMYQRNPTGLHALTEAIRRLLNLNIVLLVEVMLAADSHHADLAGGDFDDSELLDDQDSYGSSLDMTREGRLIRRILDSDMIGGGTTETVQKIIEIVEAHAKQVRVRDWPVVIQEINAIELKIFGSNSS